MTLNLDNYLQRIAFSGEVRIDHPTLAALHRCHVLSVPFENLDIHLGREIRLDLAHLADKIVSRCRGGFCYELNGTFCALLRGLGFEVKMVSGRVYEHGRIGPDYDHMTLVVQLEEAWLVDVGFGDHFLEPIRLVTGEMQRDPAGWFRIERHDPVYLRLERSADGLAYETKYLFSLVEREMGDFQAMCEYHQTSPESSFTWERLCTRATERGRVTLRGHQFSETVDGQKKVRQVMDEGDYARILRAHFQIELV